MRSERSVSSTTPTTYTYRCGCHFEVIPHHNQNGEPNPHARLVEFCADHQRVPDTGGAK